MIVIDASALLELLLQTQKAEAIIAAALAAGSNLHAPHLIDLEVTQVLRRMTLAKQLSAARGGETLQDFAQLSIRRHAHEPLIERIWQLRDSVSAYDGSYLALAEALDAPLLTCDARLAAAKGHHATIRLI